MWQLNLACHWHGAWVAAWHDKTTFSFLWFDKDGDLQVLVDEQNPWHRIERNGVDHYVSNGELAITTWIDTMKQMQVTEAQTIKAAQGQTGA